MPILVRIPDTVDCGMGVCEEVYRRLAGALADFASDDPLPLAA